MNFLNRTGRQKGKPKGVNETNQRPFFYEYEEQKTVMGPKQYLNAINS